MEAKSSIADMAAEWPPWMPIAIFGSGTSVLDMPLDEIREVGRRCVMVFMNYAMCKFGPPEMDVLAFHDASVAVWLRQGHLKSGVKLWASEAAFPLAQYKDGGPWSLLPGFDSLYAKVNCWFRSSRGNCTLTNMLHDIRTMLPDRKVLLFGADMKGTGRWYDGVMGFAPRKPEDAQRMYAATARELALVDGNRVWNCTPNSDLEVFEKKEWRKAVLI